MSATTLISIPPEYPRVPDVRRPVAPPHGLAPLDAGGHGAQALRRVRRKIALIAYRSLAPHSGQNMAPGGTGCPLGQAATGAGI
jgi:hypothetical protein